MRQAGDVHLRLPRADRFDEDDLVTGRVEDLRQGGCGVGQASERAARGHRADEHVWIAGQVAHPHPVAEQRAAGEGTGRVHGHDGDAFPRLLAVIQCQLVDERGFSRSGRAGHSDQVRPPGVGKEGIQGGAAFGGVVLHLGQQAGERQAVAGKSGVNQGHQPFLTHYVLRITDT